MTLQCGGCVADETAQDVRRDVKFVDTLTIGVAGIVICDAAGWALTGWQCAQRGVQGIGSRPKPVGYAAHLLTLVQRLVIG